MFTRILIGIIVSAIGMLMSIKSNAFLRFFGPMPWAEKAFTRGSNTGYKILGIGVFFLGVFISTNFIDVILMSIFGRMAGQV